jgi:signal transduction histidine kinase
MRCNTTEADEEHTLVCVDPQPTASEAGSRWAELLRPSSHPHYSLGLSVDSWLARRGGLSSLDHHAQHPFPPRPPGDPRPVEGVILRNAISWLAAIGDRPGDDNERSLQLRFMITTAVAMGIGGLLWGTMAMTFGLYAQSAIPWGYSAVTVVNLAVLRWTKDFPRARAVQVLMSLLLPFAFQWALGGFVASGCTMIWALLSLIAAMSFGNLRMSLGWLATFVALTVVSLVIDPSLPVPPQMADPRVTRYVLAVNVAAVSGAVFGLTRAFLQLRLRATLELAERNRQLAESQQALVQSETMAALGRLSAGMAHELNNPAAAAQRGAGQLAQMVERLGRVSWRLGVEGLDPAQVERLDALDAQAAERARMPLALGVIDRSDREEGIQQWLDQRVLQVDAAVLADLGFTATSLDDLAAQFGAPQLPLVLGRVACWHAIHQLMADVGHGAERVMAIVKALQSYTVLDRAPVQTVDLHEGLEDTIVMLSGQLRDGVIVQREYDRGLPHITAWASELNQVWTHLLDNAVDAMSGRGTIVLRTRRDGGHAVVEVIDSGPGVPPEILDRVFDPFVTTKPVGKGTGLGLNVSRNIVVEKHGGTIRVDSVPGQTCFEVRLPLSD